MSTVMQLNAAASPVAMIGTGNVVSMFGDRPRTPTKAEGVFMEINVAARQMGVKPHLALQYARQAKKDYIAGNKRAESVVSDWKAALRKVTQQVRA